MKKHFIFKALPFALMILAASCGPSKEEIERMQKEEEKKAKEHQEAIKAAMDKHKAGMDTFVLRLNAMKEKLTRPDTFYVKEGLNPAPVHGYSGSNVVTLSFENVGDTVFSESEDLFGMMEGDTKEVLNNYLLIKSGKDASSYAFYSDDKDAIDKKVAACNINHTPYALIIVRDTLTPITIGEHSYTGGETLGYCWLADLRSMEVVGRRMIYASPGEVTVTNKEGDWQKKDKIRRSCNDEAQRVINRWLKKFARDNS